VFLAPTYSELYFRTRHHPGILSCDKETGLNPLYHMKPRSDCSTLDSESCTSATVCQDAALDDPCDAPERCYGSTSPECFSSRVGYNDLRYKLEVTGLPTHGENEPIYANWLTGGTTTGFVTNLDSVVAGNQVSRSLRPSHFLVLNPPECDRTYSSVHGDQACGTGHARSMLDSPQAWSAGVNNAGQWMRIDAGSALLVYGVRAQARATPYSHQKVTEFTVQHSTDDSAWSNVDGGARFTDASGEFDARFATPVMAQYIRITIVSWEGWTSMRAGLLVDEGWVTVTEVDLYATRNPASVSGVTARCNGATVDFRVKWYCALFPAHAPASPVAPHLTASPKRTALMFPFIRSPSRSCGIQKSRYRVRHESVQRPMAAWPKLPQPSLPDQASQRLHHDADG